MGAPAAPDLWPGVPFREVPCAALMYTGSPFTDNFATVSEIGVPSFVSMALRNDGRRPCVPA